MEGFGYFVGDIALCVACFFAMLVCGHTARECDPKSGAGWLTWFILLLLTVVSFLAMCWFGLSALWRLFH